jgi:hypothetical protein
MCARYLTRFLTLTLLFFGLSVLATSSAYAQGTPDGETPAAEDICTLWGFTGKINGLCNAYCEAMDCDADEPQASDQACTRVLGKIEAALGETPFPTCEDVDNDGVPNGLDNCPDDFNPNQEDENEDTPEGDVCEPAPGVCPCIATWTNGVGAIPLPSPLGGNCDFIIFGSGNGQNLDVEQFCETDSPLPPDRCIYNAITVPQTPGFISCVDLEWFGTHDGANFTGQSDNDFTACIDYVIGAGCVPL